MSTSTTILSSSSNYDSSLPNTITSPPSVSSHTQLVEWVPLQTNNTIIMVPGTSVWNMNDFPPGSSHYSIDFSISKNPYYFYQTQVLPIYNFTNNGTSSISFGQIQIYVNDIESSSKKNGGDESFKVSSFLICLFLFINTFLG
ncbi:uncharacterized protein KGF55_000392 [Candida pseudojiufengensis]|uniref:uncharacterized protein n=1 Tax=Candida pseudojiufengensis TaxID=497109 RepID=UPI002223F5A4|nr:uncharacterized protein KGF55_000392 [Candida pseudojiufengensis]KAI5966983.1 hypothetical protein KGF55_000392 [Candida pseudojiufengensis]